MKRALANDALVLHYQPIVDLRSGALEGAEALLRFADDEGDGARLGPGEFIPVAESSGLIGAVGEWVTAEVCRQQRAWRDDGLAPVVIAINVSPAQFRQRRFAQRLAEVVREAGADARCIELEITEGAVADGVEDAAAILAAVKALGVRVALDGFGCGYSSLSRLGALPLDTLKIDRSFAQRAGRDATSSAVVEAIVAFGRTLGLVVVAEGIETDADLTHLAARGCQRGQGYFIAPPMSGEEFARRYLRTVNAG